MNVINADANGIRSLSQLESNPLLRDLHPQRGRGDADRVVAPLSTGSREWVSIGPPLIQGTCGESGRSQAQPAALHCGQRQSPSGMLLSLGTRQ